MLSELDLLRTCRRVFIRNYRIDMRIGIYPGEQGRTQKVLVNIDLWVPLERATPRADAIEEVVDHDYLRPGIQKIIARHINLQETLCDAILDLCMTHPSVTAARVRTEKCEVYADCDSAGVEAFRMRES